MKCSNQDCNRGIGLVHYRRGSFSSMRYCSRSCRDAFAADVSRLRQKRGAESYFEWLFIRPIENPQQKLIPAFIRRKAR